jgi:hypothetical protein
MSAEYAGIYGIRPRPQKSDRAATQNRHGYMKAIAPTGFEENRKLQDAAEDRSVGRKKTNDQRSGRKKKDH